MQNRSQRTDVLSRSIRKIDDMRRRAEELDTDTDSSFVQEFRDRLQHAENAVLRLQLIEDGWLTAERNLDRSLAQLVAAWALVEPTASGRTGGS